MAGTFRDFMLGLADAAPKLAELMGNYAMFSQQQQNVERQLGMEEKRTKASVKASEAQTNLSNWQADELKQTIALKVETEKITQRVQQSILDANTKLSKAQEAYINPKTGRKGYEGYTIDKMLGDIDLQMAQIQQALFGAQSEVARTALAEMEMDLKKTEFGLNVFNTFGELAVDDASMNKLNAHWDKSKGNIQNFIDYIRTDKDLELMNPRVARMLPNILTTVNDFDKMRYESNLRKAETYEVLYNANRNDAMKGLNAKTPAEFQNALLELRTRPEYDWGKIIGSVTNKSIGYTSALGSNSPPISGMGMGTMYDDDIDYSQGANILRGGKKGGEYLQKGIESISPSVYPKY